MDFAPDLNTFLHLARLGSFSEAARSLRVPRSTVSRRVAKLEEQLGVRLLDRTTRSVALTQAGRELAARGQPLLNELLVLGEDLKESGLNPRGRLRISSPPGLGLDFLAEFLSRLGGAYPELEIEAITSPRPPHLIQDGFDVVICEATVGDAPWIAHAVSITSWLALASPSYVVEAGEVLTVKDLMVRNCLTPVGFDLPQDGWPLLAGGATPVHSTLTSNDLSVLREVALAGMGVALLPMHAVVRDVLGGLLEVQLPLVLGRESKLVALYAPGRRRSPKIRAFLSFLDAFTSETSLSLGLTNGGSYQRG